MTLRSGPVGILGVLLVAAAVATGCRPPDEGASGLLVTSDGSLSRLAESGELEPVREAPPGIRQMAAAGGSIVVLTDDERFFVVSPAGPGVERATWRTLPVDLPTDGFTAGIDVSPDGRSLAIVQAREHADRLELLLVGLASGEASNRSIPSRANGPPSWLGSRNVALEVIAADDQAGFISVPSEGGEPVESGASGLALAATPNGDTVAVADDRVPNIAVADRAAWWAGDPVEPAFDAPAPELGIQDVAIDADGTRVAVVYAHGDTASWTVAVYRLADGVWDSMATKEITSDTSPTIDWLE